MNIGRLARNIASGDRARARMLRTGLTPNGYKLWRDPETGELRAGYPDYDAVLKKVRERTRGATRSKASRIHITKSKAPAWDVERDKPRMRRLYPTCTAAELMTAFPGRTWRAIQSQARKWRIYRTPLPPQSRGSAIIDSIIAEGVRRKMSVRELDDIAGRRGFFSRRRDHITKKAWRVLLRVIAEMGGTVRARW